MFSERQVDDGPGHVLEKRLSAALDEPVRLIVTDNRRTMLSARRRGGRLHLRAHHMFLDADQTVVDAIARYLRHRSTESSDVLDEHIRRNAHRIDHRGSPVRTETAGQCHDLQAMFDELNARWFDGTVRARVTWGRRPSARRRPRRSIRLGTYLADQALIRIHRVLDQAWVPPFFVRYVLFHEMLHDAIPASVGKGGRRIHTPAFRATERAYPDYQRALAWERAHLARLLRS